MDRTHALSRPEIDHLLTRADVPLREKTLWRMLYEIAARASEAVTSSSKRSVSRATSTCTKASFACASRIRRASSRWSRAFTLTELAVFALKTTISSRRLDSSA